MISPQTLSYLTTTTEAIPGWLYPYAARVTSELLVYQAEKGVHGPVFEIGVYGGKYLSVLYENASANNSLVVAIDPYEHFTTEQIAAHIKATSNEAHVHFERAYSTDLDAVKLRELLNNDRARFVSLDGSHYADDVYWDLQLAYENLHPKGIISVDDFLNTECLGVVEAVSRFLDKRPNLAPFLFTSNKLFLAPPRAVEDYKEALLAFARAEPAVGRNAKFIEAHSHNPVWGSSKYHGHWLFVI